MVGVAISIHKGCGSDGPKLAEELAKTRPGMRVLYMSGYPGAGGLATSDGSALHCIEKPFTPASLATRVREMLDSGAKPAMAQ